MRMPSFAPLLAVAAAALLGCLPAHADSITYTYTSAGPWVNNVGGGGDPIPCLNQTGCQPSGFLTFSTAIPGGEEYYNNGSQPSPDVMDSLFDSSTITLTNYSFTDGVTTFNPMNSTIGLDSIQTIFNDGTIDYWDLTFSADTAVDGVTPVLYINNEQPDYTEDFNISTTPGVASDSIVDYPFGSWTAAPTITTPEPAAWSLLGTGALALFGIALLAERRRATSRLL